jgi:hypothetical protein
MCDRLIPLEASVYYLMHLLGASEASGILFLLRQGDDFRLLPFFPCQGARQTEEDLQGDRDVVHALFTLLGEGWEVVGRMQVDYTAARTGAPFWNETLSMIATLDTRWHARGLLRQAPEAVGEQIQ